MPDQHPSGLQPADEPTAESPVIVAAPPPVPAGGLSIHAEDPDDEWVVTTARPGFRLRVPTAVLSALVAVAAGFWGGAYLEKHHGSSSTTGLSAFASRFAAARGTGATAGRGLFGGGGATASAGTAGIVTDVSGDTVDVTTAAGTAIVVTVSPSTKIVKTTTTKLSQLAIGATVEVTGTTGAGGKVAATSLTVNPPGTSSSATAPAASG